MATSPARAIAPGCKRPPAPSSPVDVVGVRRRERAELPALRQHLPGGHHHVEAGLKPIS